MAIAPWEELPPIPEVPLKDPTTSQASELKARNEETNTRGRVWIKPDSPEPEDQLTRNDSSASRNTSTTGQRSVKVRGRIRNLFRSREVEGDDDDCNNDSLHDMASFLKSTGPSTDKSGEGVFIFNEPVKINTSRPRYEPREPIVRADSSDLIDFFREGSPRVLRNGSARTQSSTTPVRLPTAPITPPLTAREDNEMSSPLPSQTSPTQIHARSEPAALSSPPANHPPEPQIDTSRPVAVKWPLPAVLTWLERNSCSPEWQQTFRILQIEGSDFIDLESGQSIRKMLTIVYPQLTRECSESGKGWDKARERAEGQRLRKLIRELPVEEKYADVASVSEKGVNPTPATQSLEAIAGDPRGVVRNPIRNASTSPVSQVSTQKDLNSATVSSVIEHEEVTSEVQAAQPYQRPDLKSHGRSVSDEWVKRWTVLSPEEIARGRQPVSTVADAFTL